MPIPGLMLPMIESGITKYYLADAQTVDPWTELGSPAYPLIMNVYVAAGVTIGSASVATPAMWLKGYNGSTINLYVSGKIGAAGGAGGGGDRGRNNNSQSSFAGGGGGGGAGTDPGAGGARATGGTGTPPSTNTDGSPGTTTTGGVAGINEYTTPGNGGYTAGSVVNRLARNPAVMVWPDLGNSITVNIWNNGSIFAGGDGGLGGFQDAPLPGGANDPTDGEDLPAYYDDAPGVGVVDHPAVGYRSGLVTLNIREGGAHPAFKGRIIAFSGLP